MTCNSLTWLKETEGETEMISNLLRVADAYQNSSKSWVLTFLNQGDIPKCFPLVCPVGVFQLLC